MTTPTERRLAITPGEAVATGQDAFMNGVPCTSVVATCTENGFDLEAPRPLCYVVGDHFDEQGRANATLYADTHNTYNSCHLTPSELLAKLREAVKYSRHDEDCGTNAARGSYAFANGCSCGLDTYLDSIEHITPPTV